MVRACHCIGCHLTCRGTHFVSADLGHRTVQHLVWLFWGVVVYDAQFQIGATVGIRHPVRHNVYSDGIFQPVKMFSFTKMCVLNEQKICKPRASLMVYLSFYLFVFACFFFVLFLCLFSSVLFFFVLFCFSVLFCFVFVLLYWILSFGFDFFAGVVCQTPTRVLTQDC